MSVSGTKNKSGYGREPDTAASVIMRIHTCTADNSDKQENAMRNPLELLNGVMAEIRWACHCLTRIRMTRLMAFV